MKENLVSKEQLKGYRKPSSVEHFGIASYMEKNIKKTIGMENVLKTIFICFVTIVIFSMLGSEKNFVSREQIASCIIVIVLILIVSYINKNKKQNKALIKKIKNGEYQVLDCYAYKVDLAASTSNGAVVYVVDPYGQHCAARFLVDFRSAKESIANKSLPFLLMKVNDNKNVIYEMFSEKKMGG